MHFSKMCDKMKISNRKKTKARKVMKKLANKDTVKLMKYAKVLGVDKQLREKLEVLI